MERLGYDTTIGNDVWPVDKNTQAFADIEGVVQSWAGEFIGLDFF